MKKGFSLIELLIALLIVTLLLGAIFTLVYRTQLSFDAERQFNETSEQARVTMDQVVRILRQAGNDPLDYMKNNHIPAVVVHGSDQVTINSDITGSYDGSTGDPDGKLDSPFEQVTVKYYPGSDEVKIKLSAAQAEQTVADHISSFSFTCYDAAGAVTAASDDVVSVEVQMTAETEGHDLRIGRVNAVSYRSTVFLRNKSFDLFEMD